MKNHKPIRTPRSRFLGTLAVLLGSTAAVAPASVTVTAEAPCDKSATRPANPRAPANPCAPRRNKNCDSGQTKPPANPCAPAKAKRPANPCAPAAK